MANDSKKIIVKANRRGERLDVVIAGTLNISRSQAQKMIAFDQITINGKKPKKAGDAMKTGDAVVILSGTPARLNDNSRSGRKDSLKLKARDSSAPLRSAHSALSSWPKGQNDKLTLIPKVIAETPDYIIIDKPSGLLVHPTQANETNTLTAWLVKNYPEVKKVGDSPPRGVRGKLSSRDNIRPGIVHRLDREASGLLVIARTQPMFELLKNQFKNRTVEKEYLALAHGKVAKDWDEITFPIARGENSTRMAARPLKRSAGRSVILTRQLAGQNPLNTNLKGSLANAQDDNGEKEARTEFFVEKRFVNFTLLRVSIHTGRMHQIRVHLLAYNHPIVGDPLYFQKKRKHAWDKKLGRLFLHSTKLGFTDLSGEKQTSESPLPKELESFLKLLS